MEKRTLAVTMEPLEGRRLLSAPAAAAVPVNINVSRMRDNQSEGAIAIDPTNGQNVFALSNLEFGTGLMAARSSDGGVTWSRRVIARAGGALPAACCDPTVAFDDFGNLYIGYLNGARNAIVVALSTDGGATFRTLRNFKGDVDQPTVAAGPGGAWVTFQLDGQIAAAGAPAKGLGKVGRFRTVQRVPRAYGNFGDIEVGPEGQVMVTWLSPTDRTRASSVYVSLDPDGLGAKGFGARRFVTATGMSAFRAIKPQPDATIDAEPDLAWDRSGGPGRGRVYMVYTTAPRRGSNTDIQLRWSDDSGRTWSDARRVNDDGTTRSQFLPRIAVDQATGRIAMSWHDSRRDDGQRPPGTNAVVNDDAELWGTLADWSVGVTAIGGNFRISQGMSNAPIADNAIDFGDYTGLAFHGGVMMPIWADNSNSTGDNPDGRLGMLDMYVARVDADAGQ